MKMTKAFGPDDMRTYWLTSAAIYVATIVLAAMAFRDGLYLWSAVGIAMFFVVVAIDVWMHRYHQTVEQISEFYPDTK